jgi:dTDP-4-dehydrorhamnose 3,5-epimerase
MNPGIRLSPDVTPKVTFQCYDPQPQIEGAFYQPLKKHRALEGWFMEHLRLTAGKVEGLPVAFEARQVSLSRAVSTPFTFTPRRFRTSSGASSRAT